MKYPLDGTDRPAFVNRLKPGRWYRCVRSVSPFFTEGKVYLCVYHGPTKLLYLIDNGGETIRADAITSTFQEATE